MIDIHSHILPGIDDGARVIEESVDMLKIAVSGRTKKMILTPHMYNPRIGYVDKEKVKDSFFRLKEVSKDMKVELYLGSEVFCSEAFFEEFEKGNFFTMNGTKYLLIEFAFDEDAGSIYEGALRVAKLGYTPILAHPERYPSLRHSETYTDKLINKGCLFQINASSLSNIHGHSAGEYALWLLENRFASFVASDAHDTVYRKPALEEMFMWLYRSFSKKYAEDLLFNNPELVLSGKDITI